MAKAPPEKPAPPNSKKTAPSPPPPPAPKARGENRAEKSPAPAKAGVSAKPAKAAEPAKPAARAYRAPEKPRKPQPAFGKKNQPPSGAAFAARLPLSLGKRFDYARAYLLKQDGVREDVYFYGPETGWALRYLMGERPLCSLHVYDEQPLAIVSLDQSESAVVDWRGLSPVGQKARKQAHGSPALLWLDLPLQGPGAGDFKAILRAKLAAKAEDGDDEATTMRKDTRRRRPQAPGGSEDDVVEAAEDADA
jgi:hypothetical protein